MIDGKTIEHILHIAENLKEQKNLTPEQMEQTTIRRALANEVEDFLRGEYGEEFAKYVPMPDNLGELQGLREAGATRHENDIVGYRMSSFPQLTEMWDGIQEGLHIIGGRSSHGKTTLSINILECLLMDKMLGRHNAHILYIAVDDSSLQAQSRLVASKGEVPISSVGKYKNSHRLDDINFGYNFVEECFREKHMTMVDSNYVEESDDIENYVEKLYKDHGELIVFLDGSYNVEPSRTHTGNIVKLDGRQGTVKLFTHYKKIADKYRVPMILTAELTKNSASDGKEAPKPQKKDLMETGKIEYHAATITMIYPKISEDEFRKRRSQMERIPMVVDVQKNKRGPKCWEVRMHFDPKKGKLIEDEKSATVITYKKGVEIRTEKEYKDYNEVED